MRENEWKYRGPDAAQNQLRDTGDHEARRYPDEWCDQQPLLDVARVGRGQILADQRRTLAHQGVIEPSRISYQTGISFCLALT
jgi:hypothetical protein